jgi:hypothetical protein
MNWRRKSMRSQSKLMLIASLAAITACDVPDPESQPIDGAPPDRGVATEEIDAPTEPHASGTMIYEDAEDFAILHDTSNLRPPDMDENDYRRLLQQRSREELSQLFPDMTPATQADLELLSIRWFVQGTGCIAQNHSERAFSIAAHFSSSTDPRCSFTVPWKSVGPSASVILAAPAESDCPSDQAVVTINDEYGFFIDTTTVRPSESLP